MRITLLDDSLREAYDRFLQESEQNLFFVSDRYRLLLRSLLGADDCYLLALDAHGQIRGALPAFVCHSERLGNVLNSLPFCGSNGGIIEPRGDVPVRRRLLEAFLELARDWNCGASTIICSPFESTPDLYESLLPTALHDSRIGQITDLGQARGPDELMAAFHSKTRNMIRKAVRQVEVGIDNSAARLNWLGGLHARNMQQIGVAAKPPRFFELVHELCTPDRDFRLYVASLDGHPVAGLLLFYARRVVEYFTPAVEPAARSSQPLSLLIYRAMIDAVSRGMRYWNWGGTTPGQQGVYRFKSRWGTSDRPYRYFTVLDDPSLRAAPRDVLLREFPYFYVYPFTERPAGVVPGAAADGVHRQAA